MPQRFGELTVNQFNHQLGSTPSSPILEREIWGKNVLVVDVKNGIRKFGNMWQ